MDGMVCRGPFQLPPGCGSMPWVATAPALAKTCLWGPCGLPVRAADSFRSCSGRAAPCRARPQTLQERFKCSARGHLVFQAALDGCAPSLLASRGAAAEQAPGALRRRCLANPERSRRRSTARWLCCRAAMPGRAGRGGRAAGGPQPPPSAPAERGIRKYWQKGSLFSLAASAAVQQHNSFLMAVIKQPSPAWASLPFLLSLAAEPGSSTWFTVDWVPAILIDGADTCWCLPCEYQGGAVNCKLLLMGSVCIF